ncbi:hypothetical protein SteCoe_38162 [Stentor coeruleus]|uniref:Uncharacterized protein n=1 Tax=Stentor coeruleus TaxID=5963 RepID=A0A1R2ALQ6_9CILI|nr:hypothetical protein SteCoe_38162 [Stentor coeruleus]
MSNEFKSLKKITKRKKRNVITVHLSPVVSMIPTEEESISRLTFYESNKSPDIFLNKIADQKDMETNTDFNMFQFKKKINITKSPTRTVKDKILSFKSISPVTFLPDISPSRSTVIRKSSIKYLRKSVRYSPYPDFSPSRNGSNLVKKILRQNVFNFNNVKRL